MVITKVTFQNSTEVPLVDHDHVVQALAANTSDNPFRVAILPRAARRYRNFSETQSVNACTEIMTIDPITISYQVARHGVVGKRFHQSEIAKESVLTGNTPTGLSQEEVERIMSILR